MGNSAIRLIFEYWGVAPLIFTRTHNSIYRCDVAFYVLVKAMMLAHYLDGQTKFNIENSL